MKNSAAIAVYDTGDNHRGSELAANINKLGQSLTTGSFTVKKAIVLCCYAEGIQFVAGFIFHQLNMSFGLVPQILYLAVVLIVAREMGKDELSRIFAWRDIPLPIFAGVLVMFYGAEIILSEIANMFHNLLPVPTGFFDGWFYEPQNFFLVIVSTALFPGFTEEIFFRGILARKLWKTYSPLKAILISALLFGIIHMNPWQAVGAFFDGCFFGWLYWRYKSIWLCMFAHAYHNVLATLFPAPYVAIENANYQPMWRHPLWFDIMGLVLFGIGLLTVIVLSKKKAETPKGSVE